MISPLDVLQKPQPASAGELDKYIEQIFLKSADSNSQTCQNSVLEFKNYIKTQYIYWANRNEANIFIQELFIEVSFTKLKSNTLVYLIIMNVLTGLDLGSKAIKASLVAKDIPMIKPSKNPFVWKLLDRLLVWLSSPLGTSLHLTLQALRDLIWKWFFSQEEEEQISSLFLLDIFIRRFPSSLNSNFKSTQSLLFRALHDERKEIQEVAGQVLESMLILHKKAPGNHTKSIFCEIMKSFIDLSVPIKQGYVTTIARLFEKYPEECELFQFTEPPLGRISLVLTEDSFAGFALLPLAYRCSYKVFQPNRIGTILDIYCNLFQQKQERMNLLFKFFGDLVFQLETSMRISNQRLIDKLVSTLSTQIDSKEAAYAFLSVVSPRSEAFPRAREKIFSFLSTKIIAKGLRLFCSRWPKEAPAIRRHIIELYNILLLKRDNDISVYKALRTMKEFEFKRDELEVALIIQYANIVRHNDNRIRELCVDFLVAQQREFPEVKQRLLAYVTVEQNPERRMSTLKRINTKENDFVLIHTLYALMHDEVTDIRHTAFKLLTSINGSSEMITSYISEMVHMLKNGSQLDKCSINNLMIAAKCRPDLLEPFNTFLTDLILKTSHQKSASLRLLSRLVDGKPLDNLLPQIVQHLSNSLTLHSTNNRISAALDLLIVTLKNSYLKDFILNKYSYMLIKIISLSEGIEDKSTRNKLINALTLIGVIRKQDMHLLFSENPPKRSVTAVQIPDSVLNKISVLNALSVNTSLGIILDVLEDPALSPIYTKAVDSLIAILKNNRNLNSEFEESIVLCLKELICNGDPVTVSKVLHNISVFITVIGDKFEPIMQPLVDLICNNWGKIDIGMVLGAVRWMAYRIPEILEPHIVKITSIIVPSIPMLSSKHADDVFSLFAAIGPLIHDVDYIVVPAILNRLEKSYNDTLYAVQILEKLCPILNEVGIEKYASEVIRIIIIACSNNPDLCEKAFRLLTLIAAKQRDVFVIYLPEITPIFDMQSNDNMSIIMECIASGVEMPQYIQDEFAPTIQQTVTKGTKTFTNNRERVYLRGFNFKMPVETWDPAEWSHWSDELIPSCLVCSMLRSISACVSLSEQNATVRSLLFPISLAAAVVAESDGIVDMIKCVLNGKDAPDNLKRMMLATFDALDIAEFDAGVPISLLARQAKSVGQNAQALRYFEQVINRENCVEELTFLQQTLGLKRSANVVLRDVRSSEIHDSCAIHLGFWDEALASYDKRIAAGEEDQTLINSRMLCLMELNRFSDLEKAAETANNNFYKAVSAFHTFNDENLMNVIDLLDDSDEENALFFIFKSIKNQNYYQAKSYIDMAMDRKSVKVASSIANDYERAYVPFAQCCVFNQLREVIDILKSPSEITDFQLHSWLVSFNQLSDSPLYMLRMLRVHALVLSKDQMIPFWMSFLHHTASMNNEQLREIVVKQIGDKKIPEYEFIMTEVIRYNKSHSEANQKLLSLISKLPPGSPLLPEWERKCGLWLLEDGDFQAATEPLCKATLNFKDHAPTWLAYSKACFQVFEEDPTNSNALEASIKADLSAFELSPVQSSQYIQHIATLIFQKGSPKIYDDFRKYLSRIPIYVWINLLPQIVARLGGDDGLKDLMEEMVIIIGKAYPSAVIYALMVQYRGNDEERQQQSAQLIEIIRQSNPVLVDGILTLTSELIRVSLSWFEKWIFVIDEASRLHSNPKQCTELLLATHKLIDVVPETMLEVSFLSQFGTALNTAKLLLEKYLNENNEDAFKVVWTVYGNIINGIRSNINSINKIPLEEASPILAKMNNTDIVVPGLYNYDTPDVKIFKFDKTLRILNSKQRPRKFSVFGNDGRTYAFLLKANEDTRLDERVMLLFNFINSVISHSPDCSQNLTIESYKVVPITQKVGLIGWVPGCSTISTVIADYRGSRDISPFAELEAVQKINHNFETASDKEKLRLFKIGIRSTPGVEIKHILFAFSNDSQHWLERRNMFTASLASTSMSGYLLGLGDRHPSNIMMSDSSAKLIHIDFGDCFEVTMHRKTFPEKVPFRLTRALTNALGVAGVEGEFKGHCETIMALFRENSAQIMALLEAFICDPLLQWTSTKSHERPEIGIIQRIKDKIKGQDFSAEALTVNMQVNMLIDKAKSEDNLSKMFKGWYPWL